MEVSGGFEDGAVEDVTKRRRRLALSLEYASFVVLNRLQEYGFL